MGLRAIRGATTVKQNSASEILGATRELLVAIMSANPGLQLSDLSTVWFTLTNDLNAVYPAQAARELGWTQVPLMCACEIPVPGSLPRCIRVLLQWNTDLPQSAIQHMYLRDAVGLRSDLNG